MMCNAVVLEKSNNLIYQARFSCNAAPLSVHKLMHELRDFLGAFSSGKVLEEQLLIIGESLANMSEHSCNNSSEKDIVLDIAIFDKKNVFTVSAPVDYVKAGKDLYCLFSRLSADNPDNRKYKSILSFISRRYPYSGEICGLENSILSDTTVSSVDDILNMLSERGRGLFLIKHLTGGMMEFDYDGQNLIQTMTYML